MTTLQDIYLRLPQLYSDSSAAAYAAAFRRVEKLTGRRLVQIPADDKAWTEIAARIVWAGEFPARTPEASQRAFHTWQGKIGAAIRLAQKADDSGPAVPADARAGWDLIRRYVSEVENTFDTEGKRLLPNQSSRSIDNLIARVGHVAPTSLDAGVAHAALLRLPADKTGSFRNSIRFFDKLIAARDRHAPIAALLPAAPIGALPTLRDARIDWRAFSEEFRASMDAAIDRALRVPRPTAPDRFGGRLGAPREGMRRAPAGRGGACKRQRKVRNPAARIKGHRAALSWLARHAFADRAEAQALPSVAALVTPRHIESAALAFVARAERDPVLLDSKSTTSLGTWLSDLSTLARRNDLDEEVIEMIEDLKYELEIAAPGEAGMSREREAFVKILDRDPEVARAIITGPRVLAREAKRGFDRWDSLGDRQQSRVLHLAMAAAMLALQLSRPLRTKNVHELTISGDGAELLAPRRGDASAWIEIGRDRVKNRKPIENTLRNWAWEVINLWLEHGRPRWIERHKETGSRDNDCLLPAVDGEGPVCRQLVNRSWNRGMRALGLPGLTPHMMRHVTATLYLAVHPGAYEVVAAILCDEVGTVEDFYARGEGRAAADLLADVLEQMQPGLLKGAF
jgi:hypothetical protein